MTVNYPDIEGRRKIATATLEAFIKENPGCTAIQIMEFFFPSPHLFTQEDLRYVLLNGLYFKKFERGDGLEFYVHTD